MAEATIRERAGRDIDRAMGAAMEAKGKLKSRVSEVKERLPKPSPKSTISKPWGDWGGFDGEFGGPWTTGFLTFFVPTIPFLLYRACTDYDCTVSAPLLDLATGKWTMHGLWEGIPPATPTAWAGFLLFIAFQVFLYYALPGERVMGLPTPAGNVLPYKINGRLQSSAPIS